MMSCEKQRVPVVEDEHVIMEPEENEHVSTRGQYSVTHSGCFRLVRRSRKRKNSRMNIGALSKGMVF